MSALHLTLGSVAQARCGLQLRASHNLVDHVGYRQESRTRVLPPLAWSVSVALDALTKVPSPEVVARPVRVVRPAADRIQDSAIKAQGVTATDDGLVPVLRISRAAGSRQDGTDIELVITRRPLCAGS